jgi:hypothetical protein
MADIYENASTTIAATCCSDSDQGLFSRTQDELMRANSIGDTGLSVRRSKPAFPIQPHHHRNDDLWPLLSRAWVYQERRLSSSVIHLARDQLYWECQTCFISEDGRESNFRGAGLKQGPIFSDSAWRHAVNHYSLLDITHDSDRLPAISAIVQRLQSVRKDDTYVAGMWMKTHLQDLSWRTQWGRARPRPAVKYPTWSWISVKAGIDFFSFDPFPSAQLVCTDYKIVGPSHIGFTDTASITLSAPSITVTYSTFDWDDSEQDQQPFVLEGLAELVRDSIVHVVQSVDFDYRTANPAILPGQRLVLPLLWHSGGGADRWAGILLRSVGEQIFERVGLIWLLTDGVAGRDRRRVRESMDSLPVKQFKII